MKRLIKLFILLIFITSIVGCSNDKSENKTYQHEIHEISNKEDVTINTSLINEVATYYNYLVDGVTIQIFAVRGTDNVIRILFNTCGACNPSPTAYFVQNGDYFVCQTCGNRFHRDDIGLEEAIGCSPVAILEDNQKIDNDKIIISSEFIETYKESFKNIKKYENEKFNSDGKF